LAGQYLYDILDTRGNALASMLMGNKDQMKISGQRISKIIVICMKICMVRA
jgi:hypothetical protein